MKIKKLFAMTAALCICLNMAACGGAKEETKPAETTAATTTTTVAETATTTEATTTAAPPETTTEAATTTEKETTTTTTVKEEEPVIKDGIVKIKLQDDEVDITLPYTVDVPLAEGKAEFVYPSGRLKTKLYEAPSEESAVVTELMAGTDVTVYVSAVFKTSNFVFIKTDEAEGWCKENDIMDFEIGQNRYDGLHAAQLPENCYDEMITMYVLPESLDIKDKPDDNANVIYTDDKNSGVQVLGDNGSGWYFVEYSTGPDWGLGWVKQDSGAGYDNLYEWEEYTNRYTEMYGKSPVMGSPDTDKPVIYLYPEKEMQVDVKLTTNNAKLWTTYPKYDNGWSVTATPEGKLTDKDGHTYDYLFWDAKDGNTYDMSRGFCVKGEDTVDFLREKLTQLGLNETEMNEFITYWLPRMEHNEYNLVAFQTEDYDRNFPLSITPEPDSVLRLLMTYKPMEEYTEIEPQELDSFERKGFTVVEWGGEELGENYLQ